MKEKTIMKQVKWRLQCRRTSRRLKDALKNGDIKVFYQPKIEAGTTRIIGAEALVRWQKADGSFIYPDEFIPQLEKTGKIVELDFFVYSKAFQYIKERLDAGKEVVPISLNVSRAHLEDGRIFDYIRRLFAAYNIPPKYIEFELTESMYVENMDSINDAIIEYREKGGKISMDDFGSGYSSLNLLRNLPIDTLKVDRVFLGRDNLNENAKTILSCVIDMAKKLHLEVVCEGVETQEQSWFLSILGCDIFQGYLYSKPIPENEFTKYLETHLESKVNEIHFPLKDNLFDDTKQYEGVSKAIDLHFCKGPAKGLGAVHFNGGEPLYDCIELPVEVIKNTSFSINMWIKADSARLWSSVYYAGYENGFCSIMPVSWDMKANMRIKDSSLQDGWFDVGTKKIELNKWTMITACYNSVNRVSTIYIDGLRAGIIRDAQCLLRPTTIYIGGDIYAKGFEGCISEVSIFDQSLSFEEVKNLYERVHNIQEKYLDWEEKNESRDADGGEIKELQFSLDGTLEERNNESYLEFNGEEVEFTEGRKKEKKALLLKGGETSRNIFKTDKFPQSSEGYTITFWMREDEPQNWSSILYIKTEKGFISEMPTVPDEHTILRLKHNERENEWRDTISDKFVEKGKWHFVTIVYNKHFKIIANYIDGKACGIKDDCFDIGEFKEIIIGGDDYQNSFRGAIAEISIYNKPMGIDEIMERESENR